MMEYLSRRTHPFMHVIALFCLKKVVTGLFFKSFNHKMSHDSLYIVCTQKSVSHLLNIDNSIIFFLLLYTL